MIYYLDTDICIFALRGTYPALIKAFSSKTPDRIRLPSVVVAELMTGARKSGSQATAQKAVEAFMDAFEIAPFDLMAAEAYASIRSDLEEDGICIGPNDLIVAATVLSNHGTLVTHNVQEFSRVPGLRVQDWTAE